MTSRTLVLAVVAVAAVSHGASAEGSPPRDQRPSAAQIVPPGFKVTLDRDMGPAFMFEATKPNDACPKPHANPDILVGGGRTPNPAAAMVVEMMASQPEDEESLVGVTRDEPLGRERYRGGVLTWRQSTTPWVGSGQGKDLVTISGAWAGPGEGALLSAGVSRFCGSKEAVRGWIDGMIDRLTAAK